MTTRYGGAASSQLGNKKPELKSAEREIFDKPRYIENATKTNKSSISSDFIEQQKAMRTQRELETSKKFLQQELEISKKQVTVQQDDFEKSLEQYKHEMQYQHKEELDRAHKR